uniref:Calpain catalytic domain-containing protein n=1 Tax=Timema monikensis TaxID=170555 RepID=A0A7R9HUK1_9NEOP|nr:unnamed protein product [Timema monikensis]
MPFQATADELEAETKDGLVKGHAYSVTKVKLFDFKTRRAEGQIPLIRLRNPWGQIEWKGPWSDKSPEWRYVPEDEKKESGLKCYVPCRSPEWSYVPKDEKKESGLKCYVPCRSPEWKYVPEDEKKESGLMFYVPYRSPEWSYVPKDEKKESELKCYVPCRSPEWRYVPEDEKKKSGFMCCVPCRSPEWRYVPEDEKKKSGLTFDNDGEFFMSLKYFHSSFSELEICNLSADSLTTKTLHEEGSTRWEMSIFEGSWVIDLTAGGCGRFTVELVATWLALFENFSLGDPIRLQDHLTQISAALEFVDC